MQKLSIIELHQDSLRFSAGHFTVFSATERERLHGHNYNVYVAITLATSENGLNFDYRLYQDIIKDHLKQIHRSFLLPAESPYLTLQEEGDHLYALFNDEKIPFLKKDVVIMPISNITVEELSHWLLSKLLKDKSLLDEHHIQELVVKVYNGPSQSGAALWKRDAKSSFLQ